MWESHYSPPAPLYLSQKHSEDSTVKPESWQLQTTTLLQDQRQRRDKGKKKKKAPQQLTVELKHFPRLKSHIRLLLTPSGVG